MVPCDVLVQSWLNSFLFLPIGHHPIVPRVFVYLFFDFLYDRLSFDCDSPAFPRHSWRSWSLFWDLRILIPRCPVFLRHLIGFDVSFGPFVELDVFVVVLVSPDVAGYPRDRAFLDLVSNGFDDIKRAVTLYGEPVPYLLR